jgi:Tol biopolymer transport system component
LYTAGTPDDLSIFALRPDEGTTEEIVRGAAGPGATPDGGTIVYLSMVEATLSSLWRADADGRGPELLAPAAGFPRVAPDGRQVLYGTQGTWIVPIDGGKPTRIMDLSGLALDVSPDGRRLVAMSGNDAGTLEIVVCELPACDGQRRLAPSGLVDPFQRGSTLRFTPEGDGIAYVNVTSEPNVWIDGSTPWQLTRFTDGRDIYDFAWSHDGERLAVAHGTFRSDIVLFTVPDAGSG